MTIRNPFKKTFKQKRESIGVDREFNDTRTRLVGSMKVTNHPSHRQANPKIRQIETLSEIQINGIKNKLKELSSKKTKNELEARRQKEAISKLKSKINKLEFSTKNKTSLISAKRNEERKLRQGKLIEKKLKSIIKDSAAFKRNASDYVKYKFDTKIDPLKLRQEYEYFLKTKRKSFADITLNEAVALLDSAIVKK